MNREIENELACIESELAQITHEMKELYSRHNSTTIWHQHLRGLTPCWQTTATRIDQSTQARAWLAWAERLEIEP